jgi:hypothetical protein
MRLEIYLCLIGVIFAMAGISTIDPRCCALKFVSAGILIIFEVLIYKKKIQEDQTWKEHIVLFPRNRFIMTIYQRSAGKDIKKFLYQIMNLIF